MCHFHHEYLHAFIIGILKKGIEMAISSRAIVARIILLKDEITSD